MGLSCLAFLSLLSAGQVLPPDASAPSIYQPIPAEIVGWNGFKALNPTSAAPVESKAFTPGAAKRVKIIVLEGTSETILDREATAKAKFPVFRIHSAALFSPAKRHIDAILSKFEQAYKPSEGRLFVVERVDQTLKLEMSQEETKLAEFAKSRVNLTAGFVPEDKVYRGPFDQVLLVYPSFQSAKSPELLPVLGGNPWNFEALLREKLGSEAVATPAGGVSNNVRASIGRDKTDGTEIFSLFESGLGRGGVFRLPISPTTADQPSYLTFEARIQSADPFEIKLIGTEKQTQITLCGDPQWWNLTDSTPIVPETWQQVSIPVPAGANTLQISAPRAALFNPKLGLGSLKLDLRNVRFTTEKPIENPANLGETPGNILLSLANSDVTRVQQLTSSPVEDVRYNALTRLLVMSEPLSYEAGIKNLNSVDQATAYMASNAVSLRANAGDPAATQALLRLLETGFTANKANAARILSEIGNKDLKLDSLIGTLINAPNLEVRLAGFRALSLIKTPRSDIFRSIFLKDSDPWARGAMLDEIQGKDSANVWIAVQWLQVNDNYDWVRTKAALALSRSDRADLRSEAYKSARDDSPAVRLAVLEAWSNEAANQPDTRQAFRLAVVDEDDEVKLLGLKGFSNLSGEVSVKEVQNLLSSPNPRIKQALKDLATKKGFKIPEL